MVLSVLETTTKLLHRMQSTNEKEKKPSKKQLINMLFTAFAKPKFWIMKKYY